jgi:dTDP-4-dehydrorhamnose reductase
MRILVTGGHGQLGHALAEALIPEDVLFTDSDDMDITNQGIIDKTFTEFKPDFLVHGAAYTNVDGCEENPEIAEAVNAKGTENLAKACQKHDVKMIYISTDYVFDGTKTEPYTEEDKPNPQSVYGKTKLAGEEATKTVNTWWILRTSWVYGDGKNFVKTMLDLSEKMDEIRVVSDQVGRPTAAIDLAKAIYDVIKEQPKSGIYHVTGDGPIISWADFAKKIFEIANKQTQVAPITTEEYLSDKTDRKIAVRPKFSGLDLKKTKENGVYSADWGESLKKYLVY